MEPQAKILLVEDEDEVREAAKVTLELDGYNVTDVDSAISALEYLEKGWQGVIISDVKMPGMNGLELLARVKESFSAHPVILVTGHGDISMALSAIRNGAYDFIEKPVSPDLLLDVVKRAVYTHRLEAENRELKNRLAQKGRLDGRIIGSSQIIENLRGILQHLADADVDVLVLGETGTGKELIARSLHDFGPRKAGQFVALNCGALPETVIESELFGHEAGSFTGASKRRIGKIEYSSGGTLFLDEIESMPMHLQVKLLRVLQERVVERLGGNEVIPVDLRVIAATKVDLLEEAKSGNFRDDFFYRLSVAQVEIPPLRDRLSDIPLLFSHFVQLASERLKKGVPDVEPHHIQNLMCRSWEGNVRELRNVAERFVLGISKHLSSSASPYPEPIEPARLTLDDQLDRFERQLIESALERNNGRITDTADELSIPRKKLYLRMKRFGLDKTDFKSGND